MEENKNNKMEISKVLLILAIVVIAVMSIFIYKLNSDKAKEIQKSTELQSQVNNLTATVNNLQGKLDSISDTINSTGSENDDVNTSNVSFSDEQVKTLVSDYLELDAHSRCDDLLEELTRKGKLKYDSSKDNILDDGKVITRIKYVDYKNAMLNYVSEEEFERNWHNSILDISENSEGYLTKVQGGGSLAVYTIKKITNKGNNNYFVQTTYITDESEPTPVYEETYNITVKEYNGNCVIDSIKDL